MPFFRPSLDISQALPREARLDDLPAVSRLLRDQSHRFVSYSGDALATLIAHAPVMVLDAHAAIWAAAVAGWVQESVAWLRGLAIADGLPIGTGLDALLPPFHALLRVRGVRRFFYAGDTSADRWIQPALLARGYVRDTDVVVYEKRDLMIPSTGNMDVRVRSAQVVDLPAVLAVDRVSFDPQWCKDEGIIGPALVEAPFFVVAEIAQQVIGYAFATSHYNGRLVHLVRIAVAPSYRGQGVGVRLMAALSTFAQASGAEVLTLNTQADNHAAQRLYEWFGFRRTGERQVVLRCDL